MERRLPAWRRSTLRGRSSQPRMRTRIGRRSRVPAPGVVFGRLLDRGQARVPETVEEAPRVGEPFGAGAVQSGRTFAAFGDQPGLAQDTQVLGDVWPADVEARGDFAGRPLAVPDESQDVLAAGFGDGFEERFHDAP